MPFLTEELWHAMGYGTAAESIMRADWPVPFTPAEAAAWGPSPAVTEFVEAKHELVSAGRALRAEYGIAPTRPVRYVIVTEQAETAARLQAGHRALAALLRAETIEIGTRIDTHGMPGSVVKLGAIHLPLTGLVDVPAEVTRVQGEIDKSRKLLAGVEAKLGNASFVERAPAAVVGQQQVRREELRQELARLEKLAAMLAAME
jgi:valyl-tRNA synthetase